MKLDKKKRMKCNTDGAVSIIDISGSFFFNNHKRYNCDIRNYWYSAGKYLDNSIKSVGSNVEDLIVHE